MTSDRLPPHLALSTPVHDRLGLRRTDDTWLDAVFGEESTRVLVVAGTRIRPVDGQISWVPGPLAPAGTRVLLGERDGSVHAAVLIDAAAATGAREEWLPLRGLLPYLQSGQDTPLLFHAIGLAEWHHATRYCPRCAGALHSRAAGHELVCADCGKPQFPRSDPAVIMAVTHGEPESPEEQILLGRQRSWPAGRWSTLAGFVEPGETFEDAVRREVMEEVGIVVGEVTYFGNQPWPLPQSLMVGFLARAESRAITVDGTEIEEARWFSREEMRAAAESGEVLIPRSVSISSSLLEHWYADRLPGARW